VNLRIFDINLKQLKVLCQEKTVPLKKGTVKDAPICIYSAIASPLSIKPPFVAGNDFGLSF